jgi:multiple sugar transport system substrate-binding protein
MMFKLRHLLATLAIITLVAQPATAETKLRFYSWQTDDQSNSVWWLAANKAFEAANPGVSIEFVKVPRDSFADTMMVMFSGDTPPDIVHLASFEFPSFAQEDFLEDLTPYIKKDGLDLTGWAGQEKCVIAGKTVCINLNYFGYLMFYNAALLKAAGAEVPHDWASYLDAARKVTAAGGGQSFGVGLHTTAGAGQYLTELLAIVLDAGGRWSNAAGKPTIDTPEVIEGLRHWKQLQTEKLTPMGLKAEDVRQLFIEGRIGLRLDGPWMWSLLAKARPELQANLKVAETPTATPLGGTSNVIAMPAQLSSERKKIVWDYIKLVTSQHWQEQYVVLSGQLAPRPHSLTEEALAAKPFLATFQAAQDKAAALGIDRLPTGFETTYNEFAKIITEEAQRMVIENADPAAVAKKMQARVTALQRG